MGDTSVSRWISQRGQRPVRVANCSGSMGDRGYQMLRQISLGDVDFVTGDYLAELNLAQNAEAYAKGSHAGYEPTAWDGLQQSLGAINEKRVKIVINGGALNPLGLARRTQALVVEKGLDLRVAAVVGDDVTQEIREKVESGEELFYLDSLNQEVQAPRNLHAYKDQAIHPIVAAHAYLGARGILKALENAADIVICGRVADASPVIAAAQFWYSWPESAYDELAGSLVAGHLIECSAYITGANFAGFDKYPSEQLFDLPFGIAEIESNGSMIITKHETTTGIVTIETVKCQLMYEIQGNVYLNSDVKAYLDNVTVKEVAQNRIRISGVRGAPPPPTTKLAVAYKGGFQAQLLFNLGGYAVTEKQEFYEKQIRHGLTKKGLANAFDELHFQFIGTAVPNASTMLQGSSYCRVFMAAPNLAPIVGLLGICVDYAMQHVSGAFGSTDLRTAMPLPYLGYFPALYPQSLLNEKALMLGADGIVAQEVEAGHPSCYEDLAPRPNYDGPENTDEYDLTNVKVDYGATRTVLVGDIALARSGDKGANVNIGLFVNESDPELYDWFHSWLTRDRMRQLMGDDWRDEYHIERVEFPKLSAVHFVIYGLLGRGVSSTPSLDCLGKGFADWIRSRVVDVPIRFLTVNTAG